MKLAILTPSVSRLGGGLFGVVSRQAQELANKGIHVNVLSHEDPYTKVDLVQWKPLVPQIVPTKGLKTFAYAPSLQREITQQNPDLLHSHGLWTYASIAANRWGKKARKPFLVTPHGMLDAWALRNSHWKKVLAGLAFERSHLKKSACIHALCFSEVQSIREYGLKNPISLIPNGIDLPQNQHQHFNRPWDRKIPDGSKILLYVGRIHPKKGITNLIRAWNILKRHKQAVYENWVLVIVGWDQGGHEGALQKQVHEFNLADSVFFLGPQFNEQKDACYYHADAFILPSFSEGLPMAVLEAWSYGLPVIMTSNCNMQEGFEKNAALEISHETKSLSLKLIEFFSLSEHEQKQMGLNGYQLVKGKYTWKQVTSKLFSVYEWLLGGGTPPNYVIL